MNKEDLIKIFEDTKSLVESGNIKANSISTKHKVSEINSVPEGDCISNIQTINSDTVSAALEYSKLGKTCILNMASAKKSGGGVRDGAKAQEECLYRCSNLFDTVKQDFYPLSIEEGVYTKDAVFFKDKNYSHIDPFTVDVVTVPALNLNPNAKYDNLDLIKDYDKITKNKIRLMFYLAKENGCKNIILGAWGCGVFKNNPLDIANMFHEVIFERESYISGCYADWFDNIIFAVINDHNSVGDNYDVFQKFF